MIISIHIPKCGGMSLRHMLRSGFGDTLLEDYGDKVHCYAPRYKKKREQRKSEVRARGEDYFSRYRAIHGHFYAEKYLGFFQNTKWITFLRHPTSLLPSYYNFLNRKRQGALADLAKSLPSLEAFIEHPWFQNIITRQTAGLALEDFYFIGFVENYDWSSQELAKQIGIKYTPFSKNTARRPANLLASLGQKKNNPANPEQAPQYQITEHQRQLITSLNSEDIDFYQRARQQFAPMSGE